MNYNLYIARRLTTDPVAGNRLSRLMVRIAMFSVAVSLTVMLISIAVVSGFKYEIKKKRGKDYTVFREWLDIDGLDLSAFDKKDMNFRLKKIPKLYEAVYNGYEPAEEDIALIEREYLYNGGNYNEAD